jgi:hypothetical protein
MKQSLLILLLTFYSAVQSQTVPETTTQYSKIENGSIGKEDFTFSLNNGYITIEDKYYNTSTNYGPLTLQETGYSDEGLYYEYYKPDLNSNPLAFKGREMKAYKFNYDKKGGTLLIINEGRVINNQLRLKFYYTNEGYAKVNGNSSGNNNELKESNFNIEDVILNSTSLSQIMAKINFSFEQNGEKKKSTDGRYVTVNYKNNSLINPLVTYTAQGEVTQIIFLMPISNANLIGTQLIIKFGTKVVNGEQVIQRGNLTYDIRSEGQIGTIVIY